MVLNETTDAAASQSSRLQRKDKGPQPAKGATLEVAAWQSLSARLPAPSLLTAVKKQPISRGKPDASALL